VRGTFWTGFWRLSDPKISLASFASIVLGGCLAAAVRPLDWGWLALTVVGIFALEIAKNASGEIVDFDSGADLAVAPQDRSPFSGGKRVLVDHLLTRRETIGIAAAFYILAIVVGLTIVAFRDARVLALGIPGVAFAYFYNSPPLKLSYRGLGELSVALCYGPIICAGTYLVQTGTLTAEVLWLSAALGLLIGAFLWINEFPDYLADRASNKRTLVVTFGRKRASSIFAMGMSLPFLMLVAAPFVTAVSYGVWFGFAGMPFAVFAAQRAVTDPESTPRIVPAQGATLLSFVLFALGAGLGALYHR
jgi:1,4-dihydroxy-2-naphthoate octaprenyltransferase